MKKLIAPICMGMVIASQTFAQGQAAVNQVAAVPAAAAARPARVLTPEQQKAQQALQNATAVDYEDMLGKLKITTPLRPGPSGTTANYDESIANPYPSLPRPLVFNNGKPVKTAEDWTKRRAEIMEDFDREVYGRAPKKTPKVTWVVDSTVNEKIGAIAVNTKYLTGKVDNSSYLQVSVNIKMSLSVPANATAVPVIIQYGNVGNRGGFGPAPAAAANRPANAPKNWKEQVVEKGWACATLDPNSIQADNGAGLTQGIIGLVNKGQYRKVDDWGSLRAIAWGADRAIDYLETNSAVDAKKVAIEGHSRWGKAALVTMAYVPRMATAYISSSGAGGAKLHRRNTGELIENVAKANEYHWMAGNYIKYAGPLTWDDLPVDAHELIALCAPRPVFISGGTSGPGASDAWVDAPGMFMAADAAGPVYTLLGKKAITEHTFPKIETLLDGDVAFRQHAGGHTDGPNWSYFLAFADKYFK